MKKWQHVTRDYLKQNRLEEGDILRGSFWTHKQPSDEDDKYQDYNGTNIGIFINDTGERIEFFESIQIFDFSEKIKKSLIMNPGSSGGFQVDILYNSCSFQNKIYFMFQHWKGVTERMINSRNLEITPYKRRKISPTPNGINVHIELQY